MLHSGPVASVRDHQRPFAADVNGSGQRRHDPPPQRQRGCAPASHFSFRLAQLAV